MLRTGEEDEVPPKFDQEGNTINIEERSKLGASNAPSLENHMINLGASNLQCSKLGASNAPTLEDHMKKLEKLKVENKKLRAEEKKTKVYSSSSEDGDSKEEVSKKGRNERKLDKPSYNSMSFNYNTMPSSTTYTFVPFGKAPRFDRSNYNQWKHCMKNHLYSISPEV
jgi:hypothetical protein